MILKNKAVLFLYLWPKINSFVFSFNYNKEIPCIGYFFELRNNLFLSYNITVWKVIKIHYIVFW